MSIWLIFALISMACMAAAYDMARDRGRSPSARLKIAFFVGPLTLLALVILGKRDGDAVSANRGW